MKLIKELQSKYPDAVNYFYFISVLMGTIPKTYFVDPTKSEGLDQSFYHSHVAGNV